MATQIRSAIWTRVMDVHAFVNTTWNETASQPATENSNDKYSRPMSMLNFNFIAQCSPHQGYNKSWDVSNEPRFPSCSCVDFCQTTWTYHVSWMWTNRNYCCHLMKMQINTSKSNWTFSFPLETFGNQNMLSESVLLCNSAHCPEPAHTIIPQA